jgi:hypothetical protein
MKLLLLAMVMAVLVAGSAAAQEGFAGRPITTNAFGQTGYTLHKNEFAVGLGPVAFGIHENVQLETNLILWAFQIYNIDAKASVIENDNRALAVGVGAYRLDLTVSDSNDEVVFTALIPYASFSGRLGANTMGHVGGQYAHFSASNKHDDIKDTEGIGALSGTSFFAGIEHSLSDRTKVLLDGGYDATFEGARVSGAFLWGWTRFRLKMGVSYFAVGDGFVFPLVGLWWRFDA